MQSAATVAGTLQAILRESESVYQNRRALFEARATGRSTVHAMATRELGHSCKMLASEVVTLRNFVTEFDHDIAGGEIGSLAELGIRAQTLIVLLLLDQLYEAIRHDPSRYQELFAGRFRTIEDVISLFFDALGHINRLWIRHRAKRHMTDTPPEPKGVAITRSFLYRSAIRCAQRAIISLGEDSDLAHFLRAGKSRIDAPQVSNACQQLEDVLRIAVTREPDPALFLAVATLEPDQPPRFDGQPCCASRKP